LTCKPGKFGASEIKEFHASPPGLGLLLNVALSDVQSIEKLCNNSELEDSEWNI
jgi:hypothetical protein